jgi:cobalamin biosynthesis protein CbiD
MAKKKVHELKTIEDMCRIVTEENFERLIMEMADCIGFHIKLKRELTKKEYSELKVGSILWKDDGVIGMTSLKFNGEEIQIKKLPA